MTAYINDATFDDGLIFQDEVARWGHVRNSESFKKIAAGAKKQYGKDLFAIIDSNPSMSTKDLAAKLKEPSIEAAIAAEKKKAGAADDGWSAGEVALTVAAAVNPLTAWSLLPAYVLAQEEGREAVGKVAKSAAGMASKVGETALYGGVGGAVASLGAVPATGLAVAAHYDVPYAGALGKAMMARATTWMGAGTGLAMSGLELVEEIRREDVHEAAKDNIDASDAGEEFDEVGLQFVGTPLEGSERRKKYTPKERAAMVEIMKAHQTPSQAAKAIAQAQAHIEKTLEMGSLEAPIMAAGEIISGLTMLTWLASGAAGVKAKGAIGAASKGYEWGNDMGGAIIPGTIGTYKAILDAPDSDTAARLATRNFPTLLMDIAPILKAGAKAGGALARMPQAAAAGFDFGKAQKALVKMNGMAEILNKGLSRLPERLLVDGKSADILEFTARAVEGRYLSVMSPGFIAAAVAADSVLPIGAGALALFGASGFGGVVAPRMARAAGMKYAPEFMVGARQFFSSRTAATGKRAQAVLEETINSPEEFADAIKTKSGEAATIAKAEHIQPEVVAASNGALLWGRQITDEAIAKVQNGDAYKNLSDADKKIADKEMGSAVWRARTAIHRSLETVATADELLDVAKGWKDEFDRQFALAARRSIKEGTKGGEWAIDANMLAIKTMEEAGKFHTPSNVAFHPGGKLSEVLYIARKERRKKDPISRQQTPADDMVNIPPKFYRAMSDNPGFNRVLDEIAELAEDVGLRDNYRTREATKGALMNAVLNEGMSKLLDHSFEYAVMNRVAKALEIPTKQVDGFIKENGSRVRDAASAAFKENKIQDIKFRRDKKSVMLTDVVAEVAAEIMSRPEAAKKDKFLQQARLKQKILDPSDLRRSAAKALNIRARKMAQRVSTTKFVGFATSSLNDFKHMGVEEAAKAYADMVKGGEDLPMLRWKATTADINKYLPDDLKITRAEAEFTSKSLDELSEAPGMDRFAKTHADGGEVQVRGDKDAVRAIGYEADVRAAMKKMAEMDGGWQKIWRNFNLQAKKSYTALSLPGHMFNFMSNVLITSIAHGIMPDQVMFGVLHEVDHMRRFNTGRLKGLDKEVMDAVNKVGGMTADLISAEINVFGGAELITKGRHTLPVKALKGLSDAASKTYSMGDAIFRNFLTRKDMHGMLADLDAMAVGKEMVVSIPGSKVRLVKKADGTFGMSRKRLMETLARAAKKRADSLFVDYRRKGIIQYGVTKGSGVYIGLAAPYFTWAHHAAFGNGGRGILGSAIEMGPRAFHATNDAGLLARNLEESVGLSIKRMAMRQMGKEGQLGSPRSREEMSRAYLEYGKRWNIGRAGVTMMMGARHNPGEQLRMMDLRRLNVTAPLMDVLSLTTSAAYHLFSPLMASKKERMLAGGTKARDIVLNDGVGWDEIDKYLDFIGRGSPLIAGVVQNGYSNAKLATSVMGLLIGKTPKDALMVASELYARHGAVFTDTRMKAPMGTEEKAEYVVSHLMGMEWNSLTYASGGKLVRTRLNRMKRKIKESFAGATATEKRKWKEHYKKMERGTVDYDEAFEKYKSIRVDRDVNRAINRVFKPLFKWSRNIPDELANEPSDFRQRNRDALLSIGRLGQSLDVPSVPIVQTARKLFQP